jgi:uncharacterized protein YdeI (YjbR/CyaY-like superfamily)
MTAATLPRVRFFARQEQLRAWFAKNHARAKELWIGYYKQGTGKKGVTYSEAVEEALCFGWIDGQVRSLDGRTYANRYTPRRPGSRWSRGNVTKVEELSRAGRMHSAGLRVFTGRAPREHVGYSFEERTTSLDVPGAREFRKARAAWQFFQAQPPYYRRTAVFWVMSARREETRRRRLRALIRDSNQGRRLDLLAPRPRARTR